VICIAQKNEHQQGMNCRKSLFSFHKIVWNSFSRPLSGEEQDFMNKTHYADRVDLKLQG